MLLFGRSVRHPATGTGEIFGRPNGAGHPANMRIWRTGSSRYPPPQSNETPKKSPGQFGPAGSPRAGSFEHFFGLNREADGYGGFAVEHLKDMTTQQAAELALGPLAGNQFNAAVACVAFGTGDVGLSHLQNMRRWPQLFQPASLSQSADQRLHRLPSDIDNRFRELAGSP